MMNLRLVGREIAIGHIDGDALLTLGLQPVQQEGIVYMVARIAHALAIPLKGIQLVLVIFLLSNNKRPINRRLAVIHASRRQKTQ